MKIRLIGTMSGTRDGVDWPPRGSTFELPDDEAAQLCSNGMAEPVAELDADVEKAVPPPPESRGLTTANVPSRKSRS